MGSVRWCVSVVRCSKLASNLRAGSPEVWLVECGANEFDVQALFDKFDLIVTNS